MPSFFRRLSCKRPREDQQEHVSIKSYRTCSGRIRRSTPSPEHDTSHLQQVHVQESPSSTLAELPPELADLREVLERVQHANRRPNRQRALHIETTARPQRMKDTYPSHAGERSHRTGNASVTVFPPIPFHSVDKAFDKKLAELAKLRSDCLAFLCSVHGKEKDPDGYVMLQTQGGYSLMPGQYNSEYVPVTSYKLVRIDSLALSEQNMHYETALSRAVSVAEVRAQYEMHMCRLEYLRAEIAEREETCRGMRRLGNKDYDAWFNVEAEQPEGTTAIEDKAEIAYQAGRRAFELRLADAVAERGIVRLLVRCEVVLTQADPIFVPVVWVRDSKSRWANARPGWTGLDL